ncbi:hypothetical protein ACKVMT_02410 [Halobacteriales archaeon Cl-PHB]
MTANGTLSTGDLLRPSRRLAVGVGLAVAIESVLLVAYLTATGTEVTSPRYLLYPFVWINATLLAVAVVDRPRGLHRGAAAIAAAYLVVLTYVGGVLGFHSHGAGLHVVFLPPGWGPMAVLDAGVLSLTLVPFKVVGYLGLAYLVYALASRSLAQTGVGLVGLFSCVSCAGSLAGAAGSAIVGTSFLGLELAGLSYDLSTLVFLLSLGLLLAFAHRRAPGSAAACVPSNR